MLYALGYMYVEGNLMLIAAYSEFEIQNQNTFILNRKCHSSNIIAQTHFRNVSSL